MLDKLIKKQAYLPFILLFIHTLSFGQSHINKTFIGTEKICISNNQNDSCHNIDNKRPKWKWYNFNILTIKGDSVTLYQKPVRIYKKDTLFSASDGAFYNYKGTLKKLTDTTFLIMLTETCCNYCGELFETQNNETEKRIFRSINY